jgi:hypothetical protein
MPAPWPAPALVDDRQSTQRFASSFGGGIAFAWGHGWQGHLAQA